MWTGDAERSPVKREDVGQARTVQKDGANHAQLVNVPLNLREQALRKRKSVRRAQRREAERTWTIA